MFPFAFDWAAIVACEAALWSGPAWLYPLWILLIAGRIHALAALLHERAHQPPRRGSRLYDALCGWPALLTLDAMRAHHLRHHRHNGRANDPYRQDFLKRKSAYAAMHVVMPLIVVWWALRAVIGTLGLRPYAAWFLSRELGPDDAETKACMRAERGLLAFLVIVATAGWFVPGYVLHGYLVPLGVAGVLNGRRFLAEHDPATWEPRDLGHGWLDRLLFAPHNLGCHVAHHRFPSAPFADLPRLGLPA